MRAEKIWDLNNVIEYRRKFDIPIGYDMCCGGFIIGGYRLPDELPEETAEHFEELMRRSVEDGRDHLLDYAKEHGVKIEYKFDPDKEY